MIKKKRKIKVPAAQTGMFASNAEMAGIPGIQGQYNLNKYPVPSISVPQTSNQNNNSSMDNNSSGVNAGAIPRMIQGTASLVGQGISAALGNGSVASNTLGMLGTGAGIGAAFGPIGAGIGAAVGAVGGLLTSGLSGGRDAEMTSFTDYDEGQLAGFLRPGKRKRQKRERARIKMNAYNNRAAVRGTEYLNNRYAELYGGDDVDLFAYGGLTNALAYVDDGELIQTPDGTVSKVPEQGKPTDSNLVSLPEGSKILSDSLKVPGTNKTFAQVGEEMMATKKSKFNDIYAQNAAKLNEMNNKSIHDQLFEMQEAVKAKKGIKRKYKNAVIAAEEGTIIPYTAQPPHSKRYQLRQDGTLNFTSNRGEVVNIGDTVMYKDVPYIIQSRNTIGNAGGQWIATPAPTKPEGSKILTKQGSNPPITIYKPRTIVQPPIQTEGIDNMVPFSNKIAVTNKPTTTGKSTNKLRLTPADWINPANDDPIEPYSWIDPANDTPVEGELDILRNTPQSSKKTDKPKDDKGKGDKGKGTSFDPAWLDTISSIGSTIGGLMPIIANLREDPEYQRPVYNPFMGEALRTMRRRRYDINPAIRDIERNRAITNYNADQMNTNTGANLAFRLQNAVNTNRAIADLRSTESNVNNAYLGEYAQMAANLGEQWAAESRRVDEANIASRAQARNIRRAGLSGVSQYLQNNEFMRNQRNRDNMMMALYDPFLEAGFTTQDLTNFRNWLRRTNG